MSRLLSLTSDIPKIRETFRLIWDSGPRWTVVNTLLLLSQTILSLAGLYLLKLWIDAVTSHMGTSDLSHALRDISPLIVASFLVALLSNAATIWSEFANRAQSQAIADHVQSVLLQKAAQADLSHYENHRYYDMLHRVQFDATWRPREVLHSLLQATGNAVSLLAVGSLLLYIHWAIPLIMALATLPELSARLRHSGQLYQWEHSATRMERQASYINWLLTRNTHAKEIRLFNLGGLFQTWFADLRSSLREERLRLYRLKVHADLLARGGATFVIFAMYAALAYLTIRGELTLGTLVMSLQAVQRGFGHLNAVTDNVARFYENNLFLDNLHALVGVRNTVTDPPKPRPVPRPLVKGIVFEDVSFRYPNGLSDVLMGITLTIRPYEHIALVGENGAGKTTLVKLLCRLYDPTAGRILLDGVDIREFDVTALRKEISVIFQDFAQYQLTARDNIWLGNTSRSRDDARIEAAALQAGADEAIKRLPRQYDSTLGKWFEDGEELSIGEWQKVAVARSFYREAQILILDEPTSAMDPRAEAELSESFQRLSQDKTTLVITHRLSTVKSADRIIVLEGGQIAETGTHEELLKRRGEYSNLYALQARPYR